MAYKEKDLKKQLKKELKAKGAWIFAPVQTGYGMSGVPDQIVCMPTIIKSEDVGKTFGLFCGIESKINNNKPTKLQQHQLEGIAAAGGMALVITGEEGKPYKIDRIEKPPEQEEPKCSICNVISVAPYGDLDRICASCYKIERS